MILAWARLIRISNLPSAASNVLAGYLLVAGNWQPEFSVVWAIVASCLLYSAGIIGNDLHDYEDDVRLRPERPLPSGRISCNAAWTVLALLVGAAIWICVQNDGDTSTNRGGFRIGPRLGTAILLMTAIFVYDFLLKRFWFSAIFMGLCRGLNLLLGASFALASSDLPDGYAFDPWIWAAATSLVLYVTGLTLFARDESKPKPRRWLMWLGVLSMAGGIGGYVWMGWLMFPDGAAWPNRITRVHLLLVSVIAFTVVRSSSMACLTLDKSRIRGAVKTALFSLITLDAATVLLASGGQVIYSLVILGLLVVGMLLSRIVNPT